MSDDQSPAGMLKPYGEVSAAIGEVCIWWASIEDVILGLSLHMATLIDSAFEREAVWDTFHVALINMDVRTKIATAKTLAHNVNSPLSPDLFDRTSSLLNFVDNTLRNERNRWIHDTWSFDGTDTVTRLKPGAVVKRVQAHKRELVTFVERRFQGSDVLRRFVKVLEAAYDDLATLDGHLAWLASQKERPSQLQQPLPEEWTSFVHREWLTRDTPQSPPRS